MTPIYCNSPLINFYLFFQFLSLSSTPTSYSDSTVFGKCMPIKYTELTTLSPETNCISPNGNLKQSFNIELKILDTAPLTFFEVRYAF